MFVRISVCTFTRCWNAGIGAWPAELIGVIEMTGNLWNRARDVFDRVVSALPAERATLLALECADDRNLRMEVEMLLDHHERAGDGFLEAAGPKLSPPTGPQVGLADWAEALVGRKVGRFTLVRMIASGGMGCVFEASQEHPQRAVALKILRPGLGAPSALARFRHEPELLARLQHPNIAQVFEAGVHTDGLESLPYFAMELIAVAQPLTTYAAERKLSVRERLILFAKVCDAVQHGHQKGIIHRDLKPGNILVGQDGEPKVIDFGVARATDADVLVTTQQTRMGDLVGTIRYMSPEQCDGDSAKIDTRSDVYSLGVVLYELLTGVAPYDTSGTTVYAAVRVIKEETPRRPGEHVRALRGNLDAIVLKAIEKVPSRRYSSSADLAADLRRHLAHEPIEARPPTRWIRMTRWIGRRPIVTTLITCLTLIAFAAASTFTSMWYTLWRPDRLRYDRESRTTQLITASRNTLQEWQETSESAIYRFIPRAADFGGGRLALVSFLRSSNAENDAVLKAFNVDSSTERSAWTARLAGDDLNDYCIRRGFVPRSFTPRVCGAADVFPTVPGEEIIVSFQNTPNSQCVIRIYDLSGRVRYQVWQDGGVGSSYWMSNAGILVFVGNNGLVPWEKRACTKCEETKSLSPGDSGHPMVIFGIRPQLDVIEDGWLASVPTAESPRPAWYLCVWPPNRTDWRWCAAQLDPPVTGTPGAAVAFSARDFATGSSVSWELDATGAIIPTTFRPSDDFNRNPALPDPAIFDLRPLPPIKGYAEEPRVTPIDED